MSSDKKEPVRVEGDLVGMASHADAGEMDGSKRSAPSCAPEGRRTLLRRLLSGAAAAVGALAVNGLKPVLATSRTNSFGAAGTAQYGLLAIRGSATDPDVYLPSFTSPTFLQFGVIGMTAQTFTTPLGSAGVLGLSAGQTAVLGMDQTGIGVRGQSNSVAGVRGDILTSSNSPNTIALVGVNGSAYTGGSQGGGGFGIYGFSQNGHGLVGAVGSGGGAAVAGSNGGQPGTYGGVFYGPVAVVGGDFTVVGGAKSAAVLHPDGSHRRLYCVESPESWFEDFGEATLECGDVVIPLDPDFAAMVNTAKYHVFLTGYDGQADLSVYDRTRDGFRVRSAAGAGSGTFSWRVVAKRKDIAGRRFESVTIPKEPTLPPGTV